MPEPNSADVRALTKQVHDLNLEIRSLKRVLDQMHRTFRDIAVAYLPKALELAEEQAEEDR